MRTNYSLCSWKRAWFGLAAGALLNACGNSDPESIVGSGKIENLTIDAMFVERVSISIPFQTTVYNGEPRKLVVRGENNLIKQIVVKEISVGEWKISGPLDLRFEQHEDVELEIPYIDMVKVGFDGKLVHFADDPAAVRLGKDG
jgi:hypothetical protein